MNVIQESQKKNVMGTSSNETLRHSQSYSDEKKKRILNIFKEASLAYENSDYNQAHLSLDKVKQCINSCDKVNFLRIQLLRAVIYKEQDLCELAENKIKYCQELFEELSKEGLGTSYASLRGALEEFQADISIKILKKLSFPQAVYFRNSYKNAERYFLEALDFKAIQRINLKVAQLQDRISPFPSP